MLGFPKRRVALGCADEDKKVGDPFMMSLAGQTYAFLMTILAGGVIGILFDVYRVLRSAFRPRQIATAVTDLLFWIVVTPTVFALLLAGNWGELRFYVAIGLALGLLLYFQALSALMIWFLAGLTRGIGHFLGTLFYGITRVALFPIVMVRQLLDLGRGWRAGSRWSMRGSIRIPSGLRPRMPMAWRRFSLGRFFHRVG